MIWLRHSRRLGGRLTVEWKEMYSLGPHLCSHCQVESVFISIIGAYQ